MFTSDIGICVPETKKILVTRLQAEPNSIADPIKPKGAGEIGDRMIIAPHELNDAITDDDVKALVVDVAKMRNVTVIVPSEKRADYWSDVAAQVLMSDNIASGLETL